MPKYATIVTEGLTHWDDHREDVIIQDDFQKDNNGSMSLTARLDEAYERAYTQESAETKENIMEL